MSVTRYVTGIVSAAMMLTVTAPILGQDFPNKPVRILTGGAGGGGDFVARLFAQGIAAPLGQPVIVDNRVAVIAIEMVAKAPPDGYTLLVNGGSTWITPLLQKAAYDAVLDFTPISLVSREVNIVAVHPSLPVKSVSQLIVLSKARPGELNYSLSTIGGVGHLAAELFNSMAGINIVGIPYKGTAAAVTALISGEVQLTIADAGLAAPHVKSGKLRALAVTSAEPTALAPGLPTVGASLSGYEAVSVTGIFAPARTPDAIIKRLNQEIVRVLNLPDVKERFFKNGAETVGSSPEQFAATIKSDIARISKLIKDAGIKVD